jgi:4-hydroxy-2-oxoheptanedioate aldolase
MSTSNSLKEKKMPAPHNPFKAALKTGQLQIGCWLGLADPYVSEISAGAGFDWLLIDAEHAPNDLRSIVAQLQVIAAHQSHAVVRPPIGETWVIKQLLDGGAQTLLVPMIESGKQAEQLVSAVTYPPHGIRGVGSSLARASNFSAIPDYLQTAREEVCLLLQVENRAGVAALDDILAVDGVDGIFIGPSDLAADMGYIGEPGHPDVQATITDCLSKIGASGKAAGILAPDLNLAQRYIDLGATFVAIGVDVTLFAKSMRDLAARGQAFKSM